MVADVNLTYFTRDNPRALAQQYWRYGKARALTRMMHWIRPKLRQMAAAHLAAHGC